MICLQASNGSSSSWTVSTTTSSNSKPTLSNAFPILPVLLLPLIGRFFLLLFFFLLEYRVPLFCTSGVSDFEINRGELFLFRSFPLFRMSGNVLNSFSLIPCGICCFMFVNFLFEGVDVRSTADNTFFGGKGFKSRLLEAWDADSLDGIVGRDIGNCIFLSSFLAFIFENMYNASNKVGGVICKRIYKKEK